MGYLVSLELGCLSGFSKWVGFGQWEGNTSGWYGQGVICTSDLEAEASSCHTKRVHLGV